MPGEIKWSAFSNGADMQVGDLTVGLRSGVNFKFTFPSDGLKDAAGNFLLGWASVGAAAVNYLVTNNSATGNASYLTTAGADASVGLTLKTKGSGNILFTPGGTGNIQCSTHLILSTSSPATPLEAASKGYVDSKLISTPVSLADGGTNASLTATNGGIFYSTNTAGAILSGTATANQVLLSGLSSAPAWSTATYPATTTLNQLLYSSSSNVIAGLSTANNGVLVTSNIGVPSLLAGSGVAGNILMSNTMAAPSWSTAVYSNTYTINNLLYASSANTVSGLATGNNGVLITSALGVPSISSTLPNAVQDNITRLGTITNGIWNGTIITGQYGGTGVNNSGKTITLGGSLTTAGAFDSTFTMTAATSVTFPTSGTLATTSSLPALPLSLANGGTGAALTASNGGIFYSNATTGAILAGTATASQVLVSGSNGAPSWSTTPYLTQINDVNGNEIVDLSSNASAVNYLKISNHATANNPNIGVAGSDTDIGLTFYTKGTGIYTFYTAATSNQFVFGYGAGSALNAVFNFAGTGTGNSYTWPTASGTVVINSGVGSFTPTISFATPGNLSVSYEAQYGTYIITGNTITIAIKLIFTPTYTTASGEIIIAGLPQPSNPATGNISQNIIIVAGVGITYPTGISYPVAQINPGVATMNIQGYGTSSAGAYFTTTNFPTATPAVLEVSMTYII